MNALSVPRTLRLRSLTAFRIAAVVGICDVGFDAYAQANGQGSYRLPPLPADEPTLVAEPALAESSAGPRDEDEAGEIDDGSASLENVDDRRRGRRPRRPRAMRQRAHVPPPPRVPLHRIDPPRVEVVPLRHPWAHRRVLIVREPALPLHPSLPDRDARSSAPSTRARGGLSLAAGGARYFELLPMDDAMVGARLQLAAPLPTLPVESSRWLSSGTVGLSGGYALGRDRGVDGQVWHVGVVLAMGAPWTRDVVGVSIEGGVLGASYYDNTGRTRPPSSGQNTASPHGESSAPRPYGLARLTLQVPLDGDVRPFVAGDFGVAGREDGRLAGIVSVTGGLAWNAW